MALGQGLLVHTLHEERALYKSKELLITSKHFSRLLVHTFVVRIEGLGYGFLLNRAASPEASVSAPGAFAEDSWTLKFTTHCCLELPPTTTPITPSPFLSTRRARLCHGLIIRFQGAHRSSRHPSPTCLDVRIRSSPTSNHLEHATPAAVLHMPSRPFATG